MNAPRVRTKTEWSVWTWNGCGLIGSFDTRKDAEKAAKRVRARNRPEDGRVEIQQKITTTVRWEVPA